MSNYLTAPQFVDLVLSRYARGEEKYTNASTLL